MDSCVEMLRKFGKTEMRDTDDWVLLEHGIIGELGTFPRPDSESITPCFFVRFSRSSAAATWTSFMIPLVCLIEWKGAVVVEPHSDQCFKDTDSFLIHVNSVLPKRARPRELRNLGLIRDDGSVVTPFDPEYKGQEARESL